MKQLFLWPEDSSGVKSGKGKRGKGAAARKPVKMPVGHAFQTVQGILIERLDSMTDDVARIVGEEVLKHFQADHRLLARIAGRIIDGINYRFFPEAYEDGEPYTPDVGGRMDVPPNEIGLTGLVPKLPTIAIYARHLLEVGRSSPVCKSLPGVFSDAELARLGERIEGRSSDRRV